MGGVAEETAPTRNRMGDQLSIRDPYYSIASRVIQPSLRLTGASALIHRLNLSLREEFLWPSAPQALWRQNSVRRWRVDQTAE